MASGAVKKWHLKQENTLKSKMLCGRNAKMNGGHASFTTSIIEVFSKCPCKPCLQGLQKMGIENYNKRFDGAKTV